MIVHEMTIPNPDYNYFMKQVVNVWKNPVDGSEVRFTWTSGNDVNQYVPYSQCYGVCFNQKGEVLIQRRGEGYGWSLPGGTVEEGESAVETLEREFIEEVDTKIKNIILLGGQKVEVLGGEVKEIKRNANNTYQLRFYCEVDELLPQTPDPDNDEIRERLFVPIDTITQYFDWKETGNEIFSLAKELFQKFHYHADNDQRVMGERHAGIVIKDGRILLMHRIKNGREYWVIPGGHRREGDSGDATAVREVFEETGITVKCDNLIMENEGSYYYLCSWVDGDHPYLNGEEKEKNSQENFYEPLWINLEDIDKLNILPGYIKDWLLGQS